MVDGGELMPRSRLGRSAAEGIELEVGQAAEAIEIEKGPGEAFVFRFLAAEFGGGDQPSVLPITEDGENFRVGGNGLGDERSFVFEPQDAEVGVGNLGGDQEVAGMEIPEGRLFRLAG